MQAVTGAKLALLSEEPAGLIPTRTPGSVSFGANLTWRSPEEMAPDRIRASLPESVRAFISEYNGSEGTRRISGEIRAFAEQDLKEAMDSILHAVTSTAAASEAVLEVWTARESRPRIVPRELLEQLALGMREAGFRAWFGPCWTPLCNEAEVAVGVRGMEGVYECLKDQGSWEITSRHL